jgi:hypothetical protein
LANWPLVIQPPDLHDGLDELFEPAQALERRELEHPSNLSAIHATSIGIVPKWMRHETALK